MSAKTTYVCDRCRKEIEYPERCTIAIMWPNADNRWVDFCTACRAALEAFLNVRNAASGIRGARAHNE